MFQLVYDCGKELCYVNLLNFNSMIHSQVICVKSIIVLKLKHMAMIATFSHALKCMFNSVGFKETIVYLYQL